MIVTNLSWPSYFGCNNLSVISMWHIKTGLNGSIIHRFFDSSPFSPSNRYLGLIRMIQAEKTKMSEEDVAQIVVVDLLTTNITIVANTTAWDTQVGAHVQWGRGDDQLFFNIRSNNSFNRQGLPQLKGVIYNIYTGSIQYLRSPVYHVDLQGNYVVAPNLLKIRYTQLGYGVYDRYTPPNMNASKIDGIFLTFTKTGRSKLFASLYELSMVAGLDPSLPTYGFHTKFSSDGKLIMVVMRTFQNGHRIQHLFVIHRRSRHIRYILSWGKSMKRDRTRKYDLQAVDDSVTTIDSLTESLRKEGCIVEISTVEFPSHKYIARDGNHPSWIPNSHLISMNLQKFDHQKNGQGNFQLNILDIDTILNLKLSTDAKSKINYNIHKNVNKSSPLQPLAVQNIDNNIIPHLIRQCHSLQTRKLPFKLIYYKRSQILEYMAHEIGTGHPSFSGSEDNRYTILDAYYKETKLLRSFLEDKTREMLKDKIIPVNRSMRSLLPGCVPLRFVDLKNGKEVWLTQVQIESSPQDQIKSKKNWVPPWEMDTIQSLLFTKKKIKMSFEERTWRCDVHPAWSRDFKWLALNVRINGNTRQVVIAYIGENISIYFKA